MAVGGNSEEAQMDVVGQHGRAGFSLLLNLAKGRVNQGNFTADVHAADHRRLSCREIFIHLCHLGSNNILISNIRNIIIFRAAPQ